MTTPHYVLVLSPEERDALVRHLDKELRRINRGRQDLVNKQGARANTTALDAEYDTLNPIHTRLTSPTKAT